ncbi:Na+/H+ antiporter subunit E [Pseudoroseomonas rhizosphaerae]|uniref:Na+/H+ antiporter subunit E n=1 Tax=Teichococcus rhizosphaerae TaxID=1335062 RepID=A0A2C7A748_9PROT|nr:Na+/H+ antiporter subunit E [Pseudoroseomonas rhizosphaerae]PHK94190.1 Na+/H+ antiporter subunit E [Pseudoroseomonas rhizosphaerae]
MRWLLPHPVISAGLLAFWLMASRSVAPGPMLVGAIIALLGGWALTLLDPPKVRIRRPGLILQLAGRVFVDIIRSNLAVARIVLSRRLPRRTGFLHIPLALREPHALAVLACILTATPGTAWLEFDAEEGWLLIHVLDLIDEEEWVRIVKERYEAPLLEIFR